MASSTTIVLKRQRGREPVTLNHRPVAKLSSSQAFGRPFFFLRSSPCNYPKQKVLGETQIPLRDANLVSTPSTPY
jgi:hypothetical protein